MARQVVPINIGRRESKYSITIGSDLLATSGDWAAAALKRGHGRIVVVSNRKVYELYGDTIRKSLKRSGFEPHVHLIGDGERFKSLKTVANTLRALSAKGVTRTDAILALGGGVVGDVAGFAASIHLRGIDLLQIPTTLLSMIDSSVGGKTGVNTAFGKNLVGSFYQPRGVLVDIDSLQTLPRRELTAGFCEAIKQGAISGRALFEQIDGFLENYSVADFRRPGNFSRMSGTLVEVIGQQIRFKARVVQNDESESPENVSSRSRKILNFGHTFAHALERATDFKYLRHGEAVGYGIIFAARLSKKLELLVQNEVNSLNDVVRRAGFLPAIGNIDHSKIQESFKHDKKRVGNSLHWILLRGIGKPVVVPDTEIPRSAISSTLKTFF